jgi:hypothetical protein
VSGTVSSCPGCCAWPNNRLQPTPSASAALRCDQRARGSHTINARKGKKESAGQPDPAASRCPYPDVLRSNPRCEALGTTVHKREASSGLGPGEDAKDEHV